MEAVLQSLMAGLPVFLTHSAMTFAVLIAGVFLYVKVTPHDELALIRSGNVAAALSLAGAIVGMALPLAVSLSVSVSNLDILVWGFVATVLQIIAFRGVDFVLKDISARIEDGEMSAAVLLVAVKVATAMVNAAALAG